MLGNRVALLWLSFLFFSCDVEDPTQGPVDAERSSVPAQPVLTLFCGFDDFICFLSANFLPVVFVSLGMAQSQGWLRRYFKALCKGFFVAMPVAVTFLDRVACVARVEGSSMQVNANSALFCEARASLFLTHWKWSSPCVSVLEPERVAKLLKLNFHLANFP